MTGGTIVQYAREQGWTPPYDPGHALGWEDGHGVNGLEREEQPREHADQQNYQHGLSADGVEL